MNLQLLLIVGLFASTQALANIQYFKGVQPVGIAGDTTECYLETSFKNRQSVQIRTLVADPHDGELIGLGPVQAFFQSQNQSYNFVAQDKVDQLQNLIFTPQSGSLILTISDDGHEDVIQCLNLNVVTHSELEELKEIFEHFEDYTDGGNHDHDDDNEDGHDHDHHNH